MLFRMARLKIKYEIHKEEKHRKTEKQSVEIMSEKAQTLDLVDKNSKAVILNMFK